MKIKNLNLSQKCKGFLKNNQKVLLKRVLPIAMAGVIGVTASGISSSKVSKPKGESIGYTNVIPNFEYNIDGNDFVILDVGSYKNFKVSKLLTNYKLKYCDKKDIENGLIISTNADTEGEILKEVLYLKDIMKEYNTELPVYLNIDKIVQNSSLDNSRKRNLITSFLEKCTTNNIYVGVTGKDTNLKLMKDNLGIDDYDALVIKNNDTISYDGNYNYYVENKKIYKKNEELDLAKVIKDKDLNNKDRFRGDATYTYHKGDSLDEIALTTGLSVDDILYYNNIRHFPSLLQDFSIRDLIFDKNLSDGQKLYIPSTTAKAKSINDSEKVEYEKSEELLRGADISAYNTVSNWEDMAKQFQYLILKAGEGTTKDPKYESFASSAAQNNIPIGIIIIPANLTILSIAEIISDFVSFIFLDSFIILAEKDSSPTLVSFTTALPDITKLPDIRLESMLFSISFCSPVNNDSFTYIFPETTSASAGICFPASKIIKSPSTKLSESISSSFPSLITIYLFLSNNDNLSNVIFDLIC